MKLISVNIGQPREVEWRGKAVRTSIWKSSVEGRIFVSRQNLTGDAQADLTAHGGEHRALMVYQLDSYRYWQEHLKRRDFVYGQFGENLTVDGLADDEVCIGDRFSIGTAIFEITQPRVTCFKIGIRMNLPEMPGLLVAHRRPGFYFRVIQEGEIGAGDLIEKISDGPEQMTVAEIDSLLYSANHPIQSLQRALGMPALSQGWRASFKDLLDASLAGNRNGNAGLVANTSPPPAWAGFRLLRVRATKQESEDVRSFELTAEDGSSLPDALPGQHIAVRLRTDGLATPITRMYSLCGAPGTGTYRIAVKRETNGIASNYLHRHLQVGDALDASAPRGTFTLVEGSSPLVLLSAGVGVTPVLAMLHSVVSIDRKLSREVWWIHSAQNRGRHPFADEISNLVSGLPFAHRIRIYSRPGVNDRLDQDYDVEGHVDLALLQKLGVPQGGDFYLCGPEIYLRNLNSQLRAWNVPSSRVHIEAFGAPVTLLSGANQPRPHLPVDNSGSGPVVTFVKSGISFRWNQRFQSVLGAAEACDVPVKWSCRSGVCHSCESGLISGELKYSPDPLDPPAAGSALICCSTPLSDVELDL